MTYSKLNLQLNLSRWPRYHLGVGYIVSSCILLLVLVVGIFQKTAKSKESREKAMGKIHNAKFKTPFIKLMSQCRTQGLSSSRDRLSGARETGVETRGKRLLTS